MNFQEFQDMIAARQQRGEATAPAAAQQIPDDVIPTIAVQTWVPGDPCPDCGGESHYGCAPPEAPESPDTSNTNWDRSFDAEKPTRRRGVGAPCNCSCCSPGAHCKDRSKGCLRTRNRRTLDQLEGAEKYANGVYKPRRDQPSPITPEERRRRMDRRNARTRELRRQKGVTPRGPRPHREPKVPNSPETLAEASAARVRAAHAAPKVAVPEKPKREEWYVYAHRNDCTVTLPAPKGEGEARAMAANLKAQGWDGLDSDEPKVGCWG